MNGKASNLSVVFKSSSEELKMKYILCRIVLKINMWINGVLKRQKCIDRQSSALSLTVRERENYIFPQDFKLQMFLAALSERLGYQSALLILSASTRNLLQSRY